MKNSVCILLIILSGFFFNIPLSAQETKIPKKKVAVYMTGATYNDAYKKVISAKLVNAITESGEYVAVERTADFLAALSAESDYQTSGEVRDSQIVSLGQKFGVKYVVVADASELFDEYFISARMIDVETGLVERAFDFNGPAESMDQLVSLSNNVATGLIGIRQLSNSASETSDSTPTHLALCVMDKNGVYKYITTEQWSKMQEDQKIDLTKIGVCISENEKAFLLSCREEKGTFQISDMPNLWGLGLIYKYKVPLNNAMKIFGGDLIQNDWYWSCESSGDDWAQGQSMYNGETFVALRSNHFNKRKVFGLPK